MSEQETAARHQIKLNVLCSVCESVFSHDDYKSDKKAVFPFHNLKELEVSAAKGCHFCSLLERALRRRKNSDKPGPSTWPMEDPSPATLEYFGKSKSFFGMSYNRYEVAIPFYHMDCADPPDTITNFPFTEHTLNKNSWNLVLKWRQQCLDHHLFCRSGNVSTPKDGWPARLISVGDLTSPTVRVVETSGFGASMPVYMTLSHCWGSHVPVRLLTGSRSGPPEWNIKDLPKTFEDAIFVTRKLGVRYLWVDSLCIIQDSYMDWTTESTKMHNVYRNSHLNIAAAASVDSTGGLFYPRNPLEYTPCEVNPGTEKRRYTVSHYGTEEASRDELVLFTRAWVFQEWLLAPRTVVFGKNEIYWECSNLHASEIRPEGFKERDISYSDELMALRMEWQDIHNRSNESRSIVWTKVIEAYSGRSLTKFSDKLVAVAGLAAEMGKTWAGVNYLAGMWSYNLRQSLLWYVGAPQTSYRDPCCPVPSWSWASVDIPVRLLAEPFNPDYLVEIIRASVSLSAPSNIYGSVTGGFIQIRGPLVRARIIRKQNFHKTRSSFQYIRIRELENVTQVQTDGSRKDDRYLHLEKQIRADIAVDVSISEEMPFVDIYLAPFQVYFGEHDSFGLNGLVLLPTFLAPGQFRRVGRFGINELLYTSTFKDQMRARFPPIIPDEHNPHGNAPINTNLTDRYGVEHRRWYRGVNSLLSAVFMQFQAAEEEGTIREDIYGKSHGNGIYTYEII